VGLFRRRKDLGVDGIPGTARVMALELIQHWGDDDDRDDAGPLAELGIGNVPYRMTLEVTLEDGRAPYTVTGKFKVPARHDLAYEGVTVPLRADPNDPTHIELDWKTLDEVGGDPMLDAARRASTPAGIYESFAVDSRTAMVDGWVAAAQVGNMTRTQFDQAIDGAVAGGLLRPEDAEKARAALDRSA
jgi:hypothetical protein